MFFKIPIVPSTLPGWLFISYVSEPNEEQNLIKRLIDLTVCYSNAGVKEPTDAPNNYTKVVKGKPKKVKFFAPLDLKTFD